MTAEGPAPRDQPAADSAAEDSAVAIAVELLERHLGQPYDPRAFWRDWNGWQLGTEDRVVRLPENDRHPEVWLDLPLCTNSSAVLDMVLQLALLPWCTPAIVGGLLVALDDVLNLGAAVCAYGVDRPLSATDIATRLDRLG